MNDTVTLIVASDLHINSTVAICPPLINLDDGGTYHASRGQRWLMDCWVDMWDKVGKLPGRKVLILNGDLGELDVNRRSVQLITPNKSTIIGMITDVLGPCLEKVEKVIIIRGTLAHEGKASWIEEAIAQDLTNTWRSSDSIASWWKFAGSAAGVRFDIAHHGSMSANDQTRPNSANSLARSALWYYRVVLDQPAPHVVIRSHNHRYATSGDNHPATALFTPCWSLMTEYGYRQGYDLSVAHIGGFSFTCADGQYNMHHYRYEPKENHQTWRLRI